MFSDRADYTVFDLHWLTPNTNRGRFLWKEQKHKRYGSHDKIKTESEFSRETMLERIFEFYVRNIGSAFRRMLVVKYFFEQVLNPVENLIVGQTCKHTL